MPSKATAPKDTKHGSHTSFKQKPAMKAPSTDKTVDKGPILREKKSITLDEISDESRSNEAVPSKGSLLENLLYAQLTKEQRLAKKIDSIDLGESSSSSHLVESNAEELEIADRFSALKELSSNLFLDFSFESEGSSSENIDNVSESTTYSEDDFFEQFQAVTELDDISEDSREKVKPQATVARKKLRTHFEDEGGFVNPLTGKVLVADMEEIPSEEIMAPQRAQAPKSAESERASSESRSSIFSDTSVAVAKKPTADVLEDIKGAALDADDEEEAYLQFLKFEAQEKEEEQLTAEQFQQQAEERLREHQHQLNIEQTMEFLNNLIYQAVEKAEYIDESVILRRNLDKRKIITKLNHIVEELAKERSLKVYLNRQCAYYYRRKNGQKHIGIDTTKGCKKKFYHNLRVLARNLQRETDTDLKCDEKIRKCKEEHKMVKRQTDEEIINLEKLITSTFHLDKRHNLKAGINSQLAKLSAYKECVSRVRQRLLIDLHNFTELSMRMKKLEDLGNGLNLKHFENLATENKALTRKIEERDATLEKLQMKYNNHVHFLAHLRERQKWMRHIVSVQENVYFDLLDYHEDLRIHNNTIRLERMKLKQQIRDISFQSGLLDKPILMLDYDDTVQTANKLRHSNGELKKTVERLTKKIAVLEDMCAKRKSSVKVVKNSFPDLNNVLGRLL